MKISCPACSAKYSIADEKVSDRLAKIRCRKCGTTIVIDGKVSPPNVYASDGASMPTHDSAVMSDPTGHGAGGAHEYSVDFGDNDQRTMSVADLVAAYNAGSVTSETFVWADGMADWKPLGEVPEIVDALHAAAGSGPEQAPAPSPAAQPAYAAPSPFGGAAAGAAFGAAAASPFGGAAAAPTPAASPFGGGGGASAFGAAPVSGGDGHSRAAVRGRGASTADLFGSLEQAGSEDDVATSAPGPVAAQATGARNESSVLFSLSALTSAAPSTASTTSPSASAPSKPSSGSATREDSGLIDLKALTASADKPDAGAAAGLGLAPAPLGLAPLGMGSPLGAPTPYGGVEAQIAPPAKSKTGLFIGGGIAVAAIAIAVAIFATKEPPPAPAPTAAAPAPTPAPTPTPTQETTTAKAPATGTAGEDEKPPEDKTKTASTQRGTTWRKPSGTSTKAGSTSGGTSAGGATEAPKPKPKASACGCPPGDLQCAMQCAAKGGK